MTTFSDGIKVGNRRRTIKQIYVDSSVVILDFVPATLDRDGICAAQQIGAAGNLSLNGALVSGGVGLLDAGVKSWGRCVGVYSGADLSAITFTVRGFDIWGAPVSENIAGPNNTTTAGLKAFSRVTSVYANAAVGSNVEVGTIDKFGLPLRLSNLSQVVRVGWNATLADNAATIAVGVTTSPATATTGDPRGTVIPASQAADGTRRLTVVYVPDMTSSLTQYGVRHFASGLE
jgi:hypothetical protein